MIEKLSSLKVSALALSAIATLAALSPVSPVRASTFAETEVEQSQFAAVSQPYGENKYNLLVIEQIPEKQACWSETGANPVAVDLLLANFDFTGHCRRSTDANGYSIRYNGQDLGLDYILTLMEKDGALHLIGINRRDIRQPAIFVGTTEGMAGQPMKIKLNPGWKFTKRTYEGKVLGHVYFSYSDAELAKDASVTEGTTTGATELESVNSETMTGGIEVVAPSHSDPSGVSN